MSVRSALRRATVMFAVLCAPSTDAPAGESASTGATAAVGGDARALMERVDQANRARFESAEIRMDLSDPDGRPVTRTLRWHATTEDGLRTLLLKFMEPSSLRGIGLLVIESRGEPNAVWHYQPATRNVRRVSGAHRQNRFIGSEFTFEDFEGLRLDRDRFTPLRREACAGDSQCQVIDARPVNADPDDAHPQRTYWIDPRRLLVVRIGFHDGSGALVKVFESGDFHQINGHWRARRQTMTNLTNGRATVLTDLRRSVDEAFDPYYVSRQYLRAP